jgi:hypothetical protein
VNDSAWPSSRAVAGSTASPSVAATVPNPNGAEAGPVYASVEPRSRIFGLSVRVVDAPSLSVAVKVTR